jgi:hypothetical protein
MHVYSAGLDYGPIGQICPSRANVKNMLFSYAYEALQRAIRLYAQGSDQDLHLYIAGNYSPEQTVQYGDAAGQQGFLETFAHDGSRECALFIKNRADLRLFVDSGAFTVWKQGDKIDLGAYIAFAKEVMRDAKCHLVFAALDVIPGTLGSKPTAAEAERACAEGWDNYQTMLAAGVPCIMTYHQFDDPKWLKKIADSTDYMAFAPRKRGVTYDEKVKFLRESFTYLYGEKYLELGADGKPKKPKSYLYRPSVRWNQGVKVHGLGISSVGLLERFPFYSVDSTRWLQGAKAAAYRVFSGRQDELYTYAEWQENFEKKVFLYNRERGSGDIGINPAFRYRDAGDTDRDGKVGVYFFVIRAMKQDVAIGKYVTDVWRQRGVVWND